MPCTVVVGAFEEWELNVSLWGFFVVEILVSVAELHRVGCSV